MTVEETTELCLSFNLSDKFIFVLANTTDSVSALVSAFPAIWSSLLTHTFTVDSTLAL